MPVKIILVVAQKRKWLNTKLPTTWSCKNIFWPKYFKIFLTQSFHLWLANHINTSFLFCLNCICLFSSLQFLWCYFPWISNKLKNLHYKKGIFFWVILSVNLAKNLVSYNFVNPNIFHYYSCILWVDKKVCFIDTWLAKG